MTTLKDLFFAAVLLFLFDLPWLYASQSYVNAMIVKIQGSSVSLVWWAGAIVYFAMAFLLLQTKTPEQAFYYGAATYAVYDFTNLATLKNYDPRFAVADTLWGGILFALARSALNWLQGE